MAGKDIRPREPYSFPIAINAKATGQNGHGFMHEIMLMDVNYNDNSLNRGDLRTAIEKFLGDKNDAQSDRRANTGLVFRACHRINKMSAIWSPQDSWGSGASDSVTQITRDNWREVLERLQHAPFKVSLEVEIVDSSEQDQEANRDRD